MAATNMHRRIVRLLSQQPAGLVLDIPAGTGPIREELRRLGHRLVEVDLFPRPGMLGVTADACAPFPFADRSFDAVLSMEGIEHFENQTAFIRECARVLRPGGTLVLTTPNVLHLSSRLSAFFTGQRRAGQGFINEVTTLRQREERRLYHGHAYLIDAFRLRYILAVLHLRLERFYPTNISSGSLLLAPLLPLIWVATRYALWSGRRRRARRGLSTPGAAIERQLAGVALSPAVLFSRGLIVSAKKPDEAAGPGAGVG